MPLPRTGMAGVGIGALPSNLLPLRFYVGWLALLTDWVYHLPGLSLVETPGRYARALAQAPLYPAMWLWSLILSLVSNNPWLSVRRNS